MSSSSSSKLKKSKEREKRRSQVNNESSSSDKGSPTKEFKQSVGINSDPIHIYNEQNSNEHLSEEVCNTLSEDINCRLRYIIHDSLVKARLLGRDVVKYKDIEETFENLSISKVYGATATPNWRIFDKQNLLFLDDQQVNLSKIIETDSVYGQYCKININKGWYPQEPSQFLTKYFHTACDALLSNNGKLWKLTLRDISENPRVGPITDWFYRFGYFMLMKDSIPFVTLRALYLIETLENSPLSSSQVSLKQLNLLLRLILQRLASSTNKAVLKPLCSVLATLCLREPLRKMAINKIIQKLDKLYEHTLSLLTLIYFLGVEAVQSIFLPNLDRFLENIRGCDDPDIIYITKGIYGQICRANLNDTHIQTRFVYSISKGLSLGDEIMVLWKPFRRKGVVETKDEINFVPMKTQLIKTRRKVDVEIRRGVLKPHLEDVFEIPLKNCKVKKAVEDHRKGLKSHKKETRVIVGKTTLLFSVLKSNDRKMKYGCCDHSLLGYNL